MTRRRSSGRRVAGGALTALAGLALLGCTPVAPSLAPTTPTPSSTGAPGFTSGTGSVPAPTMTPAPTPTPAARPTGAPAFSVSLQPFAKVVGGPLAIAAPDDGTGRQFVAAQDGRIWVVTADGSTLPDPLVDMRAFIRSGGEQGLLGLALHPGFPTDPRFYVDFTNADGDTVVASLTIDPNNPNRADPATLHQVLFQKQPYANHNGGALAFGPDGDLYVSFGDGGGGGDPQGNGQKTSSLLGKILRLDVDRSAGGAPYAIPAGNPFANGGGAPEVWLYGLRNPWRMSFDAATGDLWIGDVGQNRYEEVDVARAGVGGLNFGWNRMEGSHCYDASSCSSDGLTLPVADYGRNVGSTIIGGYVYRGTMTPVADGFYLFADYGSGRFFAIGAGVTKRVDPVQVGSGGTGVISAFGQDVAGELYVTTLDGNVSRLVIAPK
ncbi:MAG TPA: PQQ-dependent sugar dehydrogenase [Candidatus Dormibacteraeota bacterium]|nr:PQQ-dependent sugar dehydrogenase [Candidatus Dormibacteraeota bacterium]